MNFLERQLHYPLGDTLPERGTALDVAPGVRWLRMALPFALDHINLWLLRDELDGVDGWTVVDCGIDDAGTRSAWERIFADALEGLPVLRVVCTHMHPDHMGLAHWLVERWSTPEHDCRLWISAADYQAAQLATTSLAGFGGEATARFMASHGLVDAAAQAEIRARRNYYTGMVPRVPEHYRRLIDGDVVPIGPGRAHQAGRRTWTCHVGYGHAPEHMALHDAAGGVLISGDMVLPRISTNVSVHEMEPEGDALTRYLASIGRLRALPAETLVLPSHGRPFTGLHTRIDQLVRHHDERLADVMVACGEAPQSAADLLMLLFKRKLDLHQTTFAMGESIAHLHALWLGGRLVRRRDADGVFRFSVAGAGPDEPHDEQSNS